MTVTDSGPAGYRFQDLASIELALRFIENDNIQMYIESSEDLVIVFNEDGCLRSIEVQVKQSRSDISLGFLAEVLAHFTAHKKDNFLIKRVAENDDSYALLIAGGRCLDATRPYLGSQWMGTQHTPNFLTFTGVVDLTNKLKLVKDKAEKYQIERGAAVKEFLKKKTKKELKTALQKVVIEEQVSEESLNKSCKERLFNLYRIPKDIAEKVIIELREQVIVSKKKPTADFIPLLKSTIRKYFNRTRSRSYITRPDESQWTVAIATSQTLLLSGPPKCGKTFAAEHFLSTYEEIGYEVQKGNDVATAERFLSMSVPNPRAYILEDPLGAIYRNTNASETLSKLLGVIESLGIDRKLIVTQREDVLLEVMAVENLSECSLNDIDWFDLDTSDISFLTKAWEEFCQESNVKKEIQYFVSQLLQDGEQIEVGSLRHLANTADKISDAPTRDEILKVARQDANYIASEFGKSKDAAYLLSTIAFTTATGIPLDEKELKFIVSSQEYPSLPGYLNRDSYGISYSPEEFADAPIPTYPAEIKLSTEIQSHLDNLESRRFIENFGKKFNFSHPFYRAVGQASVKFNVSSQRENLIKCINRAIYSLSADTSATMILSFDWIVERNKNNQKIVTEIIQLAIDAFSHTLFVRTQQNCYRFLLSNFKLLSHQQSAEMSVLSQRLSSISDNNIRWLNSEAVYYWGGSQDGFALWARRRSAQIDGGDSRPLVERGYNKEQAFNYAMALEHKPSLLNQEDALTLLNYEESIIRARAAKNWLSIPRDNDLRVIKKIFSDDQPNVFILALKSIIECSRVISEGRLFILVENLRKSLTSPFMASVALYRLDLFSGDDSYQENSGNENCWKIFSAVISSSLETVPDNVGVVSSRFADCITKTLRAEITIKEKLDTLFAWLAWIERKAELAIPLDDWILRVLDDVLEFIPKENSERIKILEKYSKITGTGYKLILIQEMLRHWENLTNDEINLLYRTLAAPSTDLNWKLATAIINSNKEIINELSILANSRGEEFSLNKDKNKDQEISYLIILLLCNLAPTASEIGVRAATKEIWLASMQQMISDPCHKYFKPAFENLRAYHIQEFNEVIVNSYKKEPSLVLDLLWRTEAELQGLWNSQAWKCIYEAAPSEEKLIIVGVLAKNVHSFIENIAELEICFGNDLGEEIYDKIVDSAILKLVYGPGFEEIGDSDNEDLRISYRDFIKLLVEGEPLFPETYLLITDRVKKLKYPWEGFPAILESLRMESYNIAAEKRKKNSLKTQISLEDEVKLGWQRVL